jgi:hypothetical protein
MKKFFRILGVIAIVALTGLAFASCDTEVGVRPEETIGTGSYHFTFDNQSSYDITISGFTGSSVSTFIVKAGWITNARTNNTSVSITYNYATVVNCDTSTAGTFRFTNK